MADTEDCRPFLELLRLEHKQVHEALHQVEQQLQQAAAGAPREALTAAVLSLTALQQQLESHYEQEEAGGCLEEAESRAPSVAPDVRHVKEEHVVLRRDMEQLVQRAQAATDAAAWAEVARDFAHFAEKIRAHEAAENRIMLYGFGAEAMDEIVEDDSDV